jgi:hypothetical protein
MTGTEWLAEFAAKLGVAPPDEAAVDALLELAGIAAHASERVAAPLSCWLVGSVGLSPQAAVEVARSLS